METRTQTPPFVRAQSQQAPMPEFPQPLGAMPTGGQTTSPDRSRSSVVSMLEPTLARLEEIIDQETEALRARKAVDLKAFNERKGQTLLELTKLMRYVQGATATAQFQTRMDALKVKLSINQAAIKMHLEAVREIADALSDAIRDAESDGTYSYAREKARRQ